MQQRIRRKIERAIRLIRSVVGDKVVEVSYSGGKDSDVILELTRMSGVKYRAIYKNTTIDPPGTIQHCKDMGVEIMQPKLSFYNLIRKHGMPTRRCRFCCGTLKEYKVLDIAIHGIRISESVDRSIRYKRYQSKRLPKGGEPVMCRFYGGVKKNHVQVILPILEWTDEDVAEFVKVRGLKCHKLYYDENGVFHPERRLGCMGCPLRSDNGLANFLEHPRMVRQWLKATHDWWLSHPSAKSHELFPDVFALFAKNVFFKNYEKWKEADYDGMNWRRYLEYNFGISLEDLWKDS